MHISLLGPLSARVDGRLANLGGFKQRLVLALLALQFPRFLSVDELVADLWPADPPGLPRKTLQVYVANLRREVGSHRIVHGPGGYRLSVEPAELDLTLFRGLIDRGRQRRTDRPSAALDDLERAMALCRGPVLADLCANESVATLARPWTDLRLAATEEVMDLRIRTGAAATAIGPLLLEVAEHPFHERFWALLMESFYRCGRQSDALETFTRVSRVLDEELGVEPGPELRSLHLQILRHELAPVQAPASSQSAEPPTRVAEERRTATVAVFGLPGWTELLARSDPEDLADREGELRDAVARATARFGGRVLATTDGIATVVFGHPQAGEEDPDRAVLAALEAVPQCGCAVGISTGLVYANHETALSTGATGRAAVALQAEAPAGRIVVSAATAELIAGRFLLEPAAEGLRSLSAPNGSDRGPMRVVAEIDPPVLPTPLIGRSAEQAELHRVLAGNGASTVVLLHGEAGIGKSALLAHAMTALRPRAVSTVVVRGRRQEQSRSFQPFAVPLRRRYRDAGQCAADLRLLGVAVDRADAVATRLAEVAAWPAAEPPIGDSASAGDPPLQEALTVWLTALGSARPLWLVVEDLHAIDEQTVEVLEVLPDEIGRLTMIISSRRDLLPPGLAARATRIGLDRLDPRSARALVVREAAPRHLPLASTNQILRRGAGHPLHLRLLAREAEDRAGVGVPLALDGGLRGVLDRLGPRKSLAQRCAVLGVPFDLSSAEVVADPSDAATGLERQLGALVAEGVLSVTAGAGVEPRTYEFTHELLEQVAYDSLPQRLRRSLHQTLAGRLESSGRAADADRARHLEHAGDPAAAQAWVAAGQAALGTARYAEAVTSLRRALALLATQPHDELELTACVALVRALNLTTTYSLELERTIDQARELAERLDRPDLDSYAVLSRIGVMQSAGRYADAERAALDAIDLGERLGDAGLLTLAHQYYASTVALMGRLSEAHEHLRPMELPATTAARLTSYERFSVCAGLATAAFNAFLEGRGEESAHWHAVGLRTARDGPDPVAEGLVCLLNAMTRHLDGDVAGARRLVEPVLDQALTSGNDWFYTWAQAILGWAHAREHDPAEGLTMVEEALSHSSTHYFETYFLLVAAQVERAAGLGAAALGRLELACARADASGERLFLPYIHRERAAVLGSMAREEEASAWSRSARALADQQENAHAAAILRPLGAPDGEPHPVQIPTQQHHDGSLRA